MVLGRDGPGGPPSSRVWSPCSGDLHASCNCSSFPTRRATRRRVSCVSSIVLMSVLVQTRPAWRPVLRPRRPFLRTMEEPTTPRWRELAEGMVGAIAAGEVRQARARALPTVGGGAPVRPAPLPFGGSGRATGDCTVFAIESRRWAVSLGATPELLVTQREGVVRTGGCPRGPRRAPPIPPAMRP